MERIKILNNTDDWVKSLWNDSAKRWSNRIGQDKKYRKYIINPFISKILTEKYDNGEISLLELGCGDGAIWEEKKISDIFHKKGKYLGVDISTELINDASIKNIAPNLEFLQCDLVSPDAVETITAIEKKWDLILSVFVVQEVPDIDSFMKNTAEMMNSNTTSLIITVHPDFAVWLEKNSRMKTAEQIVTCYDDKMPLWRWAGYYPIVDEPYETFYLPYFHRTVEDMNYFFNKYGLEAYNIIELPEKNHISELVKNGISPFKPFEYNSYWPRMGVAPSALAFMLRKAVKVAK
jgi:2-polyprenyl-3-methyl-5-hydroxy-6-metoxy-1,4-benzoquinol methylase